MSVEIRPATADDMPRARRFYAERQYAGGIQPEDSVLIAEFKGDLVGIVRLAREQGTMVLRGMQVRPKFQRQGIGTRLLTAVAEVLRTRECFCIPYAHLVDFYSNIGFAVIDPEEAPVFLRCRLKQYQERPDGNDYLLMRRESTVGAE
jgi:GNAT superfamily N-acetyltransferase